MKKLNVKLVLRESRMSSPYELFHKVTENFVLFKWMFFKNRPRSTFLLVRSFLVNTVIFGGYYLLFSSLNFIFMGVEVEPLLLFAGSVSVGYWVMSYNFSQRSNYMSQMYNEVVKHQSTNHEAWKILACNFAAQLLVMDLWGHRLYSWVLVRTLEEAAAWSISHKIVDFENFDQFVDATNQGKLEVGVARHMVLSYQKFLTDQVEQKFQRAA